MGINIVHSKVDLKKTTVETKPTWALWEVMKSKYGNAYPVYQRFAINLGKRSEMIIFELLWTTFEAIDIFFKQPGQ